MQKLHNSAFSLNIRSDALRIQGKGRLASRQEIIPYYIEVTSSIWSQMNLNKS